MKCHFLRTAGAVAVATVCSAMGWAALLERSSILGDLAVRMELLGSEDYRILRLDLDVTGDGLAELLLAVASRHAQRWQVYAWRSESKVAWLGEVPFAYHAFLLTGDPVTLVGTYSLTETGGSGIATYRIDSSGVRRLSLKAIDDPSTPSYDFGAWREAVKLRVAAAPLSALAEDPKPRWTDQMTGVPISELGGLRGIRVVESP